MACEDQFELNASFRKELKDLEMMETPSIGVDADGQRHWLMKVSCNSLYPLSLLTLLTLSLPLIIVTSIPSYSMFFNGVLLSAYFKLPLGLKF